MKQILSVVLAASLTVWAFAYQPVGKIALENMEYSRQGDKFNLQLDYVLDSLHLSNNQQILVTPVFEGGQGQEEAFSTVLINGRNMQYAYERGSISLPLAERYDVAAVERRNNGTRQKIAYSSQIPFCDWMYTSGARISFLYDTCGCGKFSGQAIVRIPVDLNPVNNMRPAWLTPKVTELPVSNYNGEARVRFEVNDTVLHDKPYICRNGQLIDNKDQLKVIDDSITYATSDPNVEISHVAIMGYASPESPYTHNDYLATNRSRALARYISEHYTLPQKICTYGAVPENWEDFRTQVVEAKDITEQQRTDLLELIDRPAFGPSDYDAKEKELKTSPKFAKLYSSKILPEWFPRLRATKFSISTRLKPLSDEKLAEVILTSPEKMTLNQMYRVARLYDEESPEFRRTIEIALSHFPDDPEANTLGAILAIQSGDYKQAGELLKKAGDNPQAENARGIVATKKGNFKEAAEHFDKAGKLPEAQYNKALLGL